MKKLLLIMVLLLSFMVMEYPLGDWVEDAYCMSMNKEIDVLFGLSKAKAAVYYDLKAFYCGSALTLIDYKQLIGLDCGLITDIPNTDKAIITLGLALNLETACARIPYLNFKLPVPLEVGLAYGKEIDSPRGRIMAYGGISQEFK